MHLRRFPARAAVCALSLLASPLAARSAPGGDQDPDFPDAPKAPDQTMEEQLRAAQQGMNQQINDAQAQQQEEFARLSERMQAQYDELLQRMDAQREAFHQRVAAQWSDVQESSDKTWVDYSDKTDARSSVDFEKGEATLEVLVPVEDVAPGKSDAAPDQLDRQQADRLRALAEEKLRLQTERMLAQRDASSEAAAPAPTPEPSPPPHPKHHPAPPPAPAPHSQATPPMPPRGQPVLTGQLRGRDGREVTPKDADRFVKETLAPKMVVDPKLVVGTDGKPRVRVTVKVPLVAGHVQVRADRYSAAVKDQARQLGIDSALVFAVIHTESAFNPLARSNAGAFGLMQLIPKSGAHEAFRYRYKKEMVITPEYLYQPDNNIALGATYLKMLSSSFFGKVKDRENAQVLSIASYNCGPTRVKRSVVGDRDLDSMSPEQVVALVQERAPQETKDYVVRVRDRMALYRDR